MNNKENDGQIKQAVLYYPTISLPSGKWLRQSLLYWDEIGSIVPKRYDDTELYPYTTDVQYLKDEGEFRPFRPEMIFKRDWNTIKDFENELVDIVLSDEFQSMLPPKDRRQFAAPVHQDKVCHEVFDFLQEAELAKRKDDDWDWYYFEDTTALLYMAVLAKYLADEDSQFTVPGTNLQRYEHLNFLAKSRSKAFDGLTVSFFNILPVPRSDIALTDILDFKRRRRDQLLQFRQMLNEIQHSLSACERKADATETLAAYSGKISKGLADLESALSDAGIVTIAGSFEALIKASSPAWLATAVVASGAVKNIADVPISWALRGSLVAGAIGVGKYLIDKRNERRALLRNSPFSYLYSAYQDGVLRR